MRLVSVINGPSTDTPGCIRTTGIIALEGGEELRIWVDIPDEYAEAISVTANPWLVAMLPIAASRGEAINLSLPVDALLLENLRGVLAIWREWYPELHDVCISCPVAPYVEAKAMKTAAFFSGGIDSYFTVARRLPDNPYGMPVVGKVDDLISVWGFDVRVHDEEQFRPLAAMLSSGAMKLGLRHVILRTNLRSAEEKIPFKDAWRRLSHGAGLSFVGLVLERAYGQVLIASSNPFGHLVPWGSDPMLDPLFSTSGLRIVHDGSSFTRVDKTDLVGKFPLAQGAIHVCLAQGASNCSYCEKCYRTMMTLDLLGHRERAKEAFDWSRYNVRAIRKFFIRTTADQTYRDEIIAAAKACGRYDIVSSLRYASSRSKLLRPLVKFSEWLMTLPGIWRLGIAVKAFLLRGPIRKI